MLVRNALGYEGACALGLQSFVVLSHGLDAQSVPACMEGYGQRCVSWPVPGGREARRVPGGRVPAAVTSTSELRQRGSRGSEKLNEHIQQLQHENTKLRQDMDKPKELTRGGVTG
jgi:hypothetical protein